MTGSREAIVVVGAGIAALTVVETLRSAGVAKEIAVIGEEPHLPYSRPPLSKHCLDAGWEPGATALVAPDAWQRLGCTTFLGRRATGLDRIRRVVRVDDGRVPAELAYDELVIATGARARQLGIPGGEHTVALRTLADASAIRDRLPSARRVAVLGAGILGCEIASMIARDGHEVVLVGRGPTVGFGGVGAWIGAELVEALVAHGVRVLLARQARHIEKDGPDTTVTLDDGTRLDADLVIAAVGGVPADDWLRDADLDLEDGVLGDSRGRVAEGLSAVGDVARWRDPVTGVATRHEHQAAAIEQALIVGRALSGSDEPPARIHPYFTSEVAGARLAIAGEFPPGAVAVPLAGESTATGFVRGVDSGGVRTGVIAWNMPREFRAARAALVEAREKELVTS